MNIRKILVGNDALKSYDVKLLLCFIDESLLTLFLAWAITGQSVTKYDIFQIWIEIFWSLDSKASELRGVKEKISKHGVGIPK